MSKNQTLIAPEGAKWFSDLNVEFPPYCICNKGITGCGGTTDALTNDIDTIIAMPYVDTIDNKATNPKHKDDVLGIYSGVTKEDIIEYINTHEVRKLIVTYESLPRTIVILHEQGIDVKEFTLLIDEYHCLFIYYAFRIDAIRGALNVLKMFGKVTLMSATPIPDKYMLKELKDFDVINIVWPNTKPKNLYLYPNNNPTSYVVNVIKANINENFNMHFYVNSVKFIIKIIKTLNLKPEQVKIVCSKNNDSISELGVNYKVEKSKGAVKKVNFYTSTAFEGGDVFDEDGKIYIVSDGHHEHTSIDIATLFIQICGRIRDSKYKNDIYMLYSKTWPPKDITFQEYIDSTENVIRSAKSMIHEINGIENEDLRKHRISKMTKLSEQYIRVEDNKLILDENMRNHELWHFELYNMIYNNPNNLKKELEKNGFIVHLQDYKKLPPAQKLSTNSTARTKFEDSFKQYCNLITNKTAHNMLLIKAIENRYKIIKDAYSVLGASKVAELKYNITNVNAELVKRANTTTDYKVFKLLEIRLKYNIAYTAEYIKDVLQSIYNELGINATAKSTELKTFYEMKPKTICINGTNVAHFIIIRAKIMRIQK